MRRWERRDADSGSSLRPATSSPRARPDSSTRLDPPGDQARANSISSRAPTTTSPVAARISRTYKRLAGRDPQPAPLANGEIDARRRDRPSRRPLASNDLPGAALCAGSLRTLDKARIVAVWHEANLLALGLVGVRQPELARREREPRSWSSRPAEKSFAPARLAEREKKVRLILGPVDRAQQMEPPSAPALDSRVMPGRDEISLERASAAPQAVELDLPIAHHARIRGAARRDIRRRNC